MNTQQFQDTTFRIEIPINNNQKHNIHKNNQKIIDHFTTN